MHCKFATVCSAGCSLVFPAVENILSCCDCRFRWDPGNSIYLSHSCHFRPRRTRYKQLSQNRKKPQIAGNACRTRCKDRTSRNPDCRCWDFLALKFCNSDKRKLEEGRVERSGNGWVQWCSCLIFSSC